jgi:hypothetical protein
LTPTPIPGADAEECDTFWTSSGGATDYAGVTTAEKRQLKARFLNKKDVNVTVWEMGIEFYWGGKPLEDWERPAMQVIDDRGRETQLNDPVNLPSRIAVTRTIIVTPDRDNPAKMDAVKGADRAEFVARIVGPTGQYGYCYGTPEPETLLGTWDRDQMHGDGAEDELYGKSSDDWLYGDYGLDPSSYSNFSPFGNDTLHGGYGDDYLSGDQGTDILYGDDDNDSLLGDHYNDTTAYGNDTMNGGAGMTR